MHAEPSSLERGHRRAIVVLLWALTLVCVARGTWAGGARAVHIHAREGVDPNQAPWWDLTLLPEIGPTTARAIVNLRNLGSLSETQRRALEPVYLHPVDLTRVKGIGPRTIERCGRYLRFDATTTPDGSR